jgi:MobA/MobL family
MSTYHCNKSTSKSKGGKGKSHVDYCLGNGEYVDKDEIIYAQAGNLPAFAKNNPSLFFELADMNERSNGRSSTNLHIAIPNEATDKIEWSKKLAESIVGEQAYVFSIHMKDGNPHLHLVFSERSNNALSRTQTPEVYFSKKNPKIVEFNPPQNKKLKKNSGKKITDLWLDKTKAVYLEAIREVNPGYTPSMQGGKEKQLKVWQVKDGIEEIRANRKVSKMAMFQLDVKINNLDKEIEKQSSIRDYYDASNTHTRAGDYVGFIREHTSDDAKVSEAIKAFHTTGKLLNNAYWKCRNEGFIAPPEASDFGGLSSEGLEMDFETVMDLSDPENVFDLNDVYDLTAQENFIELAPSEPAPEPERFTVPSLERVAERIVEPPEPEPEPEPAPVVRSRGMSF